MTVNELTNKVHLGDCLDVMKLIPDNSVDLVACDLPYGVTQHKNDVIIDLKKLWEEYHRVAKINAAFVLTAQFPFTAELYLSNKRWFKYDLVWDKVIAGGFLNANRMPMRKHENILVFYRKQPTYNPQFTESGKPLHGMGKSFVLKDSGGDTTNRNYGRYERDGDPRKGTTQRHPTSILEFAKPHASKVYHRTQKSLELFKWIVSSYSNPGDTVLDNSCGSGTTLIASKELSRNFIGIDLDPECVDISRRRLAEIKGEPDVAGSADI